jgi:hypothetical protein
MSPNVTKIAAGAAAVIAIGVGAAVVGASSGNSNNNQTGNQAAAQVPPGMNQPGGGPPGGGRAGGPGIGTPVTGDAATKVTQAVKAKYPGTIERIIQIPNGSYLAHVIQDNGSEVRVLVDANFNVTGTQSGAPRGGMVPPGGNGAQPPGANGAQPPSSGSGSGTTTTN